MKKLISLVFALALLGAGCSSGSSVSTEVKTDTKPASTTETKPEATKPILGTTVELKAAVTDDTWKQYVSKSLGFSFMWPTKGRYAPTWEVELFGKNDAAIDAGCRTLKGESLRETVKVDGQIFCHTVEVGSDPEGQVYFDAFATKVGETFAVILFEKHTAHPDFDPNAFKTTLNGIVGTFKLNAE